MSVRAIYYDDLQETFFRVGQNRCTRIEISSDNGPAQDYTVYHVYVDDALHQVVPAWKVSAEFGEPSPERDDG